MRFKMLMLSSMLFLAFLAVTALSVDWDNPTYDADEMFTSGEEEVYQNPVGAPATPQEARKLQENKSALNWTMPSTLGVESKNAKDSRAEAQATSESEDEASDEVNTTATEVPSVQTGLASVQGNWFFTLNDSVTRDLALTLLQNETDVLGSGKIKEGNNTLDVTASGSIAGSNMELNLVSSNPIIQYRMNLTLSDDLSVGEYSAASASGETWAGSAEGQKTS
ncbi:MAG: hypothetical protein ACP5OU_03500 [Methanothrix sp.]